VQVADHQELHSAKGLLGAAISSQNAVNAIKQVGPDHADLIDNQEIKAPDDVLFLFAEPVLAGMGLAAGNKRPEGYLEKRMQGHPAGIDGRDSGRGGDYQPFMRLLFDGMEKGGFAGAGLAGEKYRAVGLLDKGFRQVQFGVRDVHRAHS